MCGRFSLSTEPAKLADIFQVSRLAEVRPRYNIAPSQLVWTVVAEGGGGDGGRVLKTMRWGLIPSWADDPAIGNRLINARSETAASKPAFRHAMRQRRCLIPANAFYEWQKTSSGNSRGGGKQPYALRMANDSVFAFAGLWERWQDPQGLALESCTVLTTQANELIAPIHDRMPVILPPEDWPRWLDVEHQDAAAVQNLLRPLPASSMRAYPVSRLVNQFQRDDPRCLEPATPTAGESGEQLRLF